METTKKRTITLDASDEALLALLVEKNRPFASAHQIAQLAMKQGLRPLEEATRKSAPEVSP